MMQKLGKPIEREGIDKIISIHDKTGDGMLNFQEFIDIFEIENLQ